MRVEVVWSMVLPPVCLQQRFTVVGSPHKLAEICENRSVIAFGRPGAACSPVNWLSFARLCCVTFPVYEI